jgi:HlyD family secretion protein
MSCTVDIKTSVRNNVITVPIQSVTTREEKDLKQIDTDFAKTKTAQKSSDSEKKDLKEIVFVVANGKVKAQEVTTGIQDENYIEVTGGLKDSATVVTAPFRLISKTLKDGDAVKVVAEKDLFKDDKSLTP